MHLLLVSASMSMSMLMLMPVQQLASAFVGKQSMFETAAVCYQLVVEAATAGAAGVSRRCIAGIAATSAQTVGVSWLLLLLVMLHHAAGGDGSGSSFRDRREENKEGGLRGNLTLNVSAAIRSVRLYLATTLVLMQAMARAGWMIKQTLKVGGGRRPGSISSSVDR